MIHTVKGFSIVDETEVDIFLPSFLYNPVNCRQIDLWFLILFRTQLGNLEVLGSQNDEASHARFQACPYQHGRRVQLSKG